MTFLIAAGESLAENHTAGILSGLSVTNGFDAYLRRTRLYANTATAFTNFYGYDTASRLTGVTNDTFSAGYTYLANSPLLNQVTFKQSGTTRMTTTRQWDFLNRLGSIGSVPAAANQLPLSYGYLCNDANQRVRVTLADGSFWLYSYDVLGQVVSGKRYWSDGTPVPGQQYEYGFDDIGNRTIAKAGGDAAGGNLRSAGYTNNVANQLTSRGVPGAVDVLGIATASAAVTVNSSAADYRRGEYFQELVTVGNTLAPQWTLMTVTASQGGTNTTQTGYVYVPKTPEAFQYDADGNLTNDGRWAYIWDAESRLVKMEPSGTFTAASGSRRKLEFWYDHQGRRIRKKVTNLETALITDDRKFLYDGWNLLAELSATNNAVIRSYVWGLDLSGSEQGAGGVGGLLFEMPAGTNTLCAAYDGNGNVMGLVDATAGTVVAQSEYGPFGEVLRVSGAAAAGNPFRFSTKYQDAETDLLYYGFRYYSPSTGRWISRDPAREKGGLHLYAFVNNDSICSIDVLGLAGVFGPYIMLIEKALAAGETDQAAEYARGMYEDIYRGGHLFKKPLAAEFMGKWLGLEGEKGTLRYLSSEEMNGILRSDTTREWIGMRLREKGVKGSKFYRRLDLDAVYGGPPGSDLFLAFGEFRLVFTGYVEVKKNNATVLGRWLLYDRYDWQNPGNKSVTIGGSVIYDRYAELLEDCDPPKAYPFDVFGNTDVCFTDTYDLTANPIAPKGRW